MDTVSIRYIVNDVDAAIEFYRDALGFTVDMHPAPGFAGLSNGALRLLLNAPGAGGAGQSMPDGSAPAPGGWNRFQFASRYCAARDARSAARSSRATGGARSSWTTPPATPWSCSSRSAASSERPIQSLASGNRDGYGESTGSFRSGSCASAW